MVGYTHESVNLEILEKYEFEKYLLASILKQYFPNRKFTFLWEKTYVGPSGMGPISIQHIVQLRRTFWGFIKHWLNHNFVTSTSTIEGGVLISFIDGNVIIVRDTLNKCIISIYDPNSFERIASQILNWTVDSLC